MNPFSTALTLLLTDWSRRLFAGLADRRALGPITWTDVGVTLSFLLLALIANAIAALVVRRRSSHAVAEEKGVKHHLMGALGKPLYVLIWAYGVYFATAPIFVALKQVRGVDALRGILDTALDLAMFAIVFWFIFRCTHVLDTRLERWAASSRSRLDDLIVPLVGRSLRIVVPVLAVIFALPVLDLPARYAHVVSQGTAILLIATFAFLLFQAVQTVEQALLTRYDISAADNLRARKVYTQVHVIGKVIDVIIGFLTVASVLMMFNEVRHFGASLLASAGVVGIIAGIAAQKTIANLIAGFQIALAQPMRQDDVLIVEGEWGRVEEITLTYVVVHIWDDRRLVVPLSYFIEKPFQNWTRTSAGLLGSVFVWVDYTFPVDEGREALKDIIEKSPLWDRRFWNLQVSDASDRTMQLRVLATSADSSKSWDLRCEIREKFIAYIQGHHPGSLPQVRAELSGTAA
ncbi:MAG: mechanosensitive ion channel family protein [Steroidobacteraceae bacterium]